MAWIYLSPHLDDVALSCGGLVWEQAQSGEEVSIWTICAGEPPVGALSPFATQLHARWEAGSNAPARRKIEDGNSCRRLGANYRHFSIPDCIYRRNPLTGEFMYASEASLNGPLHPGDVKLAQDIRLKLRKRLPGNANLVCPLALGAHVDHQLTRSAAKRPGSALWFYADFPYVQRYKYQLDQLKVDGWDSQLFPVSQAGLLAWQDAIAAHASQISTFWSSELEMRKAVAAYLFENGGLRLWRPRAG